MGSEKFAPPPTHTVTHPFLSPTHRSVQLTTYKCYVCLQQKATTENMVERAGKIKEVLQYEQKWCSLYLYISNLTKNILLFLYATLFKIIYFRLTYNQSTFLKLILQAFMVSMQTK